MKRLLTICLVVAFVLAVSGTAMGVDQRPPLAYPLTQEEMPVTTAESSLSVESAILLSIPADADAALAAGADRLTSLQNNDGGWDWPLNDGDPDNASPTNTIGPIAMGLAKAYQRTNDSSHEAALLKAGDFLLSKTVFSPSDGYLAVELDKVFGTTMYTDDVKADFYDELAAGTYERNGIFYDTAGYVNLIRNARASQGIPNLAAWDIGMGLYAASLIGADVGPWIAGTKAEIDELDGDASYDVIGLAGAVLGLAAANEDYDPTAGEHAAAASLLDLANILAGYQLATGGFTWNSNYMGEGEDNETIQETAYALLALRQVDASLYWEAIVDAGNYTQSVQLATGGWKNWSGAGENNEVTGEAMWAIATAPVIVDIDIKPGSEEGEDNTISLDAGGGLIPVAIFSVCDENGGLIFDATTIDPATVSLEGTGVAVRGKGVDVDLMVQEIDVNGDGCIDLVIHIAVASLIEEGAIQDGEAMLTGLTTTCDGQLIVGWDDVTVVPVKEGE